MGDIYRGVIPFIVIQAIAIACVAALPQIATWLPDYALDLRGAVRGFKAHE